MELHFDLQLSSKDYKHFLLFQYNKIFFSLPALLLYLIQFNIQNNPMRFSLKLSFFLYVLLFILILVFNTIQSYKTYKTYKLILNTNQQITVNKEGVHSLSDSFNIHIAFDKIKKVYETSKYTYIYTAKNDIFILPSYKIESLETAQALQAILKNNLAHSKYKLI